MIRNISNFLLIMCCLCACNEKNEKDCSIKQLVVHSSETGTINNVSKLKSEVKATLDKIAKVNGELKYDKQNIDTLITRTESKFDADFVMRFNASVSILCGYERNGDTNNFKTKSKELFDWIRDYKKEKPKYTDDRPPVIPNPPPKPIETPKTPVNEDNNKPVVIPILPPPKPKNYSNIDDLLDRNELKNSYELIKNIQPSEQIRIDYAKKLITKIKNKIQDIENTLIKNKLNTNFNHCSSCKELAKFYELYSKSCYIANEEDDAKDYERKAISKMIECKQTYTNCQ